jgi:hypothetical protein
MIKYKNFRDSIDEIEICLGVAKAEEKSAVESLKVPDNILICAGIVKSDMAIVDMYHEEIKVQEKLLSVVEEMMPATGN